jgi:hypothetical protein
MRLNPASNCACAAWSARLRADCCANSNDETEAEGSRRAEEAEAESMEAAIACVVSNTGTDALLDRPPLREGDKLCGRERDGEPAPPSFELSELSESRRLRERERERRS